MFVKPEIERIQKKCSKIFIRPENEQNQREVAE